MKAMKKTVRKVCCLLLSLTTLFATACVSLSPSGMLPPTSNSFGGENYGGNFGGGGGQTSTPEDSTPEDSTDDEDIENEFIPTDPVTPELPETAEPDPEKTVAATETDSLGHKIVTYTDGTWEDLGRVVPLEYSTPDPTEQYGYQYFKTQTNGAGMQDLYTALHTTATQFHNSANTLEVVGSGTNKTCRLASFTLADYGVTQAQAEAVWRIFANENPAFFWIDNQISSSSTKLVLLVDDSYSNASARTSAQMQIAGMALDCDQYLNGKMSQAVLAATIHDYLAGSIEYAYKSDGVTPETELWAHTLVGAASRQKGVCETYAKTYDYLCTLFGLNCLMVTGKGVTEGSSIGHAWNAVELDGEWYDVDVTWDDNGDQEISREWFGKECTEFAESHIARTPKDGWDLNFQYDLPVRCGKTLNPVAYGVVDSGNYTLEGSLQTAFNHMTETNSEYAVYLYPHTNASEAMRLTVADRGGEEEVTFPSVASVIIYGSYNETSSGYYTLSEFTFKGEVEIPCNLGLSDLSLAGEGLDISGYLFVTMGTMVELQVDVSNPSADGALVSQTTKATLVQGYVDIWGLWLQVGEVRLCNGGEIDIIDVDSGATLCCYGTGDVTLGELILNDEDSRLYIAKATNKTQISIGTLSGSSNYATVAIDYDTAAKYPNLFIENMDSQTTLHVCLYGSISPATALTLGTTSVNVAVYQLNANDTLEKAPYAIDSNGNVNYVG